MKKNYKIYTLNHPVTNEIRYVGQTCQTLHNRLNRHLNCKNKSHNVNWIKSLKNNGLLPTINLIVENLNKSECDELEIYYIRILKEQGVNLTNMTLGGEGSYEYKHTESTKKILSEIARKRNTPDFIEILRKRGIEQWNNKTDDEKLNNIINQPNRRTILQYDLNNNLINTYLSLRQIERELGYFRANIVPCIKGKFKHAYGYIWKYKEID